MSSLSFEDLGLAPSLLTAISAMGFSEPTPIQAESIPALLTGEDLTAQAQTGTGKTAAFALPVLNKIDCRLNKPQAIILAPTRELAIQVAKACEDYARHMAGVRVCAIYGGQDFRLQLKALNRGAHIVVGTPGRLMDHLRRKTLSLDEINTVVLDEADEMLKMGFIDDIEWILEHIPHEHQTALFSATMPQAIQNIAKRYLNSAKKIKIASKQASVSNIEQSYLQASKPRKFDALCRLIEAEEVQASIIFASTKSFSNELAERLIARGYAASALHGDMNQAAREKVIARIKNGSLDFIVATDVAARGIDVERISHVFNYDIPNDAETYIHRIGRTGRAGRKGRAILFISPQEKYLLKQIERGLKTTLDRIDPPSIEAIAEQRNKKLAEKVIAITNSPQKLQPYQGMIENILQKSAHSVTDIAAALAYLIEEANPLPTVDDSPEPRERSERRHRPDRDRRPRSSHGKSRKPEFSSRGRNKKRTSNANSSRSRQAW